MTRPAPAFRRLSRQILNFCPRPGGIFVSLVTAIISNLFPGTHYKEYRARYRNLAVTLILRGFSDSGPSTLLFGMYRGFQLSCIIALQTAGISRKIEN
jgi:hypothetical protein